MALITPFRVARGTFLRDVGFFTIAVLLTLGILYDSHIHLWEALMMVGLYCFYVLVVGVGSWWSNRRKRERARMREVRGEYDHSEDPMDGEVEWETEGMSPPLLFPASCSRLHP
jgi:sodium/potassium/calcium exchanger 6